VEFVAPPVIHRRDAALEPVEGAAHLSTASSRSGLPRSSRSRHPRPHGIHLLRVRHASLGPVTSFVSEKRKRAATVGGVAASAREKRDREERGRGEGLFGCPRPQDAFFGWWGCSAHGLFG
jgi:hypothetical protein